MESDLDVGKIATEFLQAHIGAAWSLITSEATGARNVVRSKFERTYRTYLERILGRYSRGKSFFVRSEPVPLYDFFVPLDLATQRRTIEKPSAPQLFEVSPYNFIIGSGGSGKTMMMRHFLLSSIKAHCKTPLFLELRHLNGTETTIRESLLEAVQRNGLEIGDDYLEIALGAGHFLLALDGFDELQQSRRKQITEEIQELCKRYPKNWFLISSRPDQELDGWSSFTQFRVKPLDLQRAVELVQKLPFDDPIKERFITDLRSDLFVRHESFLSNPLLLSIMLLTYSDVAHIPTKLSLFYGQAYESLFQKHDALKGGFQRERRTKLDLQDFARVFAAFCMQSYDQREFSFSQSRALELLEKGKKITQLSYEARAFLDDSLQAVCLLIEEGLEITFAHRSFQEYFVARFIASCPPDLKEQLISRLDAMVSFDSVMVLLFEIDAYAVEKHYILPALRNLRSTMKLVRHIGISHFRRYLNAYWHAFHLPRGRNLTASSTNMRSFDPLFLAWRQYAPDHANRVRQEDKSLISALLALSEGHEGEPEIPIENLNSKCVKLLFDSDGVWSGAFVQDLVNIEKMINERHRTVRESLESMFAGASRPGRD